MNIVFTPDYSIYKNSIPFRGNRDNVDINKINKDLIEIRKNNFINGIYDTDIFHKSENYESNRIDAYLPDKNLQDYDAVIYDKPKDGGAPYKFAAVVKNLELAGKGTNLVRKTPEVFKGLDKTEVFNTLDTLSYLIRDKRPKETSININGKEISVDYLGEGCNSAVYKLSDNEGNTAAMKSYLKPEHINSLSMFGELAVYQGVKDRNINNIPELYMANPVSMKVEDTTKEYEIVEDVDELKDYDGYKGGWTVVEYITPDTPVKEGGISLHDWLKEKQLYHIDMSFDNSIGGYITDLGGIGI